MAINPDDMKIGLSYEGSDEGGNYIVANGKKTYIPDDAFLRKRGEDEMPITYFPMPSLPGLPGIRPPRRPSNPQSTFDNDYSFLNLPEQGSAVRDPIDIAQDALPADIIQQINRTAPRELPESNIFGDGPIVTPTRPQGILEDRNFRNTLESAIQNAESEIQQLQEVKVDLTNNYQDAIAQQDTIRATAAEEQLAAITSREQELLSERQQIITELEDKFGVEREGLETDIAALQGNVANLEGTITDLQGSIDALTVERDNAVAEQDVIRATAADEQVQALEAQKDTLAVDYNQTITDLQAEIDALNTAPVVAETAPVVADDLPVVTETSEGVITAPTAEEYMPTLNTYNPNYMGFEDERAIGRQNEADAIANLEAASAAGMDTQGALQAAKNASANLIAQEAYENRSVPITGQDLGISKPPVAPIDMSKINLPANYMDQLKNIQLPQNLNFGNLRVGMAGGGGVSRIQLLLNRLR